MNSNNLYFGARLVTAIKLGFSIHDWAVFRKKRKKHNLEAFSKILNPPYSVKISNTAY